MTRFLAVIVIALFLAGCGDSLTNRETLFTGANATTVAAPGTLPDIELPVGRTVSETFGNWEVVAYESVDFTGDELQLTPLTGEYAWAIIDLGVQHPALTLKQIYFPTAGDWAAEDPPSYAWIGLSNYSRGTWTWRFRDSTAEVETPVDFSDVPDGTTFAQPDEPHHAYMVLISDQFTLFGEGYNIIAEPKMHLYVPPISQQAGQFNQFKFNPETGEGNIATYMPASTENGGAVVRFTIDSEYNIDWNPIYLYQNGRAMQSSIRYDIDYTKDGKLAMLVARNDPVSVLRYVVEADEAGTFELPVTAVESEFLANPMEEQYMAMELDNNDNPHIVFADLDSVQRYAFRIAGSWVITGGGYADCSKHIDMLLRGTDIVTSFTDDTTTDSGLGVGAHVLSSDSEPWDSMVTIYHEPPKNGGNYTSIVQGPDSRIIIAQYIQGGLLTPGGVPPGLAIATNATGVIASGWVNSSVDNGKDELTGDVYTAGPYCRIALLRDGTPVIAYQDSDNGVLRMAVSTTVDGGPEWYRIVIDDDPDVFQVGRYIALDIRHGASSSDPDLIGIAYESVKSSKSSLRFAVIEWPLE